MGATAFCGRDVVAPLLRSRVACDVPHTQEVRSQLISATGTVSDPRLAEYFATIGSPIQLLGGMDMHRKSSLVGILAAACFVTTTLLMPSVAYAQADPRVQKSMELLKSMTAQLGAPRVEGGKPLAARMLLRCISAQPRSTTTSRSLTGSEKKMGKA